jgi:hypothetical protein
LDILENVRKEIGHAEWCIARLPAIYTVELVTIVKWSSKDESYIALERKLRYGKSLLKQFVKKIPKDITSEVE